MDTAGSGTAYCIKHSRTCLLMKSLHRTIKLSLFVSAASLVGAADHPETNPAFQHEHVHDLDPFVVDATLAPRNSRDMLNPTTVVTADELERTRAATVGQTLDGQPGVHATAFGAGSNRPVIRGMEGVRLKVMESGLDSGDLSADSPDHATAVEPFFIDRIEVLRGPSTLLFGSSAIGGAVNVIDRRIPRELPGEASVEGLISYQSAAEGWTYGALAEVPLEQFVLTASYLNRDHGDYSIPGYAERELDDHDEHEEDEHDHDEHDAEAVFGVLENSFLESETASLGLSWFSPDQTRLTLAFQTTDSLYGVPGHAHGHEEHEDHDDHEEEEHGEEEVVSIDMKQSILDLELEHQIDGTWLKSLEGRIRYVDYEHQELEGAEIGTDFDRESIELRLVATHANANDDPGAIGVQWSHLDSRAVGEEALTPESETRDFALFIVQEWHFDEFRVEGGFRAEHRDLEAEVTNGYEDWAWSGSLGSRWTVREQLSLGVLLSHSQRHPTATELFANGPHAATRQFEIGDPDLGVEEANGLDLSIQYTSPVLSFGLTGFVSDFSDYIYASPIGDEEDGLPVYQFGQADVRFIGVEAESTWHAWHEEFAWFDVVVFADWVDTDISDSSEELPRIPPVRVGAGVEFGSGLLTFNTRLLRSFEHDDTAMNELPTEAYTNWSASLTVNLPIDNGEWRLLLSGENLLDEEIRVHTSPIKDLAPAPGRHLRITLSAAF